MKSEMNISIGKILETAGVVNIPDALCSVEASVVTADTRKLKKNGVFLALKGISSDGHEYLEKAQSMGAAVAVVEKISPAVSLPQFVIPSTREIWGVVLAAFFGNPEKKMKFIGITGTNGKTTTTYILEKILATEGIKTGIIGTVEYRYGDTRIPSSFTSPDPEILYPVLKEMADNSVETVIMEVSSHSLAQRRVGGLFFNAALLTNFTQDHLDFHKTMDEYAAAKRMLFSEHLVSNAAVFAWNETGNLSEIIPEDINCVYYGSRSADVRCDVLIENMNCSIQGIEASLSWNGEKEAFSSGLIGEHNILNVTGAILLASAMGIKIDKAAKSVSNVVVPGRLARVNGIIPVFVDYAHTPDALDRAQSALRGLIDGKLITVFGCGGDRDADKRPKMGKSVDLGSDVGVVTSDNPRTEDPVTIIEAILGGMNGPILDSGSAPGEHCHVVIPDRAEAINWAIKRAGMSDCVLIAGKGHEDYQIIGHHKIHFDDSEVSAKALREKNENQS
ncbi:MAG: UDP-N-acetylmuramoyl-L-alanyl-D-glutamate--2,6-diaminopimelate ligase [Deltaproteobacteria bacterium]|nr:UDP-N-acetylmuramoyl-L-alanyl-D-glutamate--2,6-diaminopimelate ligase [Deltaproteobacteria bacterium]